MEQIETSVDFTITVYADSDYHYKASSGDMHRVAYFESDNGTYVEKSHVSFGSLDEMEAVAKAMLKIVAISR